jgi:hypothetical protein
MKYYRYLSGEDIETRADVSNDRGDPCELQSISGRIASLTATLAGFL